MLTRSGGFTRNSGTTVLSSRGVGRTLEIRRTAPLKHRPFQPNEQKTPETTGRRRTAITLVHKALTAPGRGRQHSPHVQTNFEMDAAGRGAAGHRARRLSHQPHLVSPVEPEPLLRKSFRAGPLRRARAALIHRPGRTLRAYRPQRETRRRFARASATIFRSGEKRFGGPARLSAGETRRVADALHSHSRMVPDPADRGGKIPVAQLSGKPALRRPERIPLVHGKYASTPHAAGLRVLPATPYGGRNKVRPVDREPESARTERDPAAAFRGGESSYRNEQLRRATARGKYS